VAAVGRGGLEVQLLVVAGEGRPSLGEEVVVVQTC
jgi:hypothetical protein